MQKPRSARCTSSASGQDGEDTANHGFQQLNRATEFRLGDRVEFGRNVVFGPACRLVAIGFGSYIGDDVYIDAPEVSIGDYVKIHRGGLVHGYLPCLIGHNCWVGQSTIIDSIGGAEIGNNVGIGAQSQLWSHIKFGDTLEGCRWNSSKKLVVEDDVWFVGHCIVSPIHAARRSMLLVGGVITIDMLENHVYGGVPARDLTDRIGRQFDPVPADKKRQRFEALYREFLDSAGLNPADYKATLVESLDGRASSGRETYFCLDQRTYLPSRSEPEYRFMRFLLYDRAKFLPVEPGSC